MTDRGTRSSWQVFDVGEVDAGIVANAFSVSPVEGAKALATICSKYKKAGRIHELERFGGDVVALVEAVRERDAALDVAARATVDASKKTERVEELAKDILERLRLAKMQAQDPRREEGP